MAGLCEGGNEPPGFLKAISKGYISVAGVPEFCPEGVLLHASKSTDMNLSHLNTLKCHRPGPGSNPQPRAQKGQRYTDYATQADSFYLKSMVVVITEDVQNVHFLLEYRPHIDVSLTCEHDPKLQEFCVCPQNMPQFDSEGIPNQAPETNKPMILNGPTSINREGSNQTMSFIMIMDRQWMRDDLSLKRNICTEHPVARLVTPAQLNDDDDDDDDDDGSSDFISAHFLDYHLFMHMKTWLGSKRFDDDEELKTSVVDRLQSQAAEFYDCGISKLVKRYDKCLNVTGNYVEK
ncbi:hypothetical protein ANN_18116 [Periplaneta americana]|uniref:Uncharacterized protein n=1 Tax=Periplaneta americana TaxID=6978 RepID=A0ABQ8SP39_PERAM|nr:hypothetical protein ANN_18116 [Periplaneta americana]